MDNETQSEWVPCRRCLCETEHTVLHHHHRLDEEKVARDVVIDWQFNYTLLECNGCHSVVLRERLDSFVADVSEETFHPPLVSRPAPRWIDELSEELTGLMREVYAALHAGNRRLALMGVRTMIDCAMTEVGGDLGGFDAKVKQLEDRGYLSQVNVEMLSAAIDAGHAAAHRAHEPTTEDLHVAMDIVEGLLHTLILSGRAKTLRDNTPKRPGHDRPR